MVKVRKSRDFSLDNACPGKYTYIMNRLTGDKRKAVVAALIEGCSVRSVCRMTGVAKGTVLKLLADIGGTSEYWGLNRKRKGGK